MDNVDEGMKCYTFILAMLLICSTSFAFDLSTISDDIVIAATLILEAGGERSTKAMPAVYEVISNRAQQSGRTPAQECMRRKQFSCWNNITKRKELLEKAMAHPKFATAVAISINGPTTNLTGGATHYHTISVNPYWASAMITTTTIGHHMFYRQN